jgi:hypothetical protein
MPWRDPQTFPLTRIAVVARIPSESGVYAIYDGEACLVVGEAWNLKARLLELMNVLQDVGEFHVTIDLCAEEVRMARKEELAVELLQTAPSIDLPVRELPGISFRNTVPR